MKINNKKINRAENRRRQHRGHRRRGEWRKAPATAEQLEAMRAIAMETGHTFEVGITRGQAWRRIKLATTIIDERLRGRCSPPWYTKPKERDGRPSSVDAARRAAQNRC